MTNSESPWLDDLRTPCDPKTFRRALEVWQAGSQFKLRKSNPTKQGLYLSDIPINRSAMATLGFLRARGVPNPQAYMWRAMHFGELIDHMKPGGRLAKYAKPSDEEGALMINEALLDALAVAPVRLPNDPSADPGVFDIDEIARLAEQICQADATERKADDHPNDRGPHEPGHDQEPPTPA